MATTGTYPSAASTNEVATGVTGLANFIAEIWSNEIEAEFKAQLVARNAVKIMNHRGQKGDTVHIPIPSRQSANAKAEHAAVTLIQNVEGQVPIVLNKHYEYSKLIEDIANVQAIVSQRSFYTDDAAFSIAKQMDTSIHTTFGEFGKTTSAYDGAVIGSDGSTAWNAATSGNGASLADAGIRKVIQTLDDNDVPQSERSLIIPPVERNTLMGLARFTEQAYVGETGMANTIRNGVIGNLYGVTVRVSSNCATIESADSTNFRVAAMLHKSAVCLIEQIGIRVQAQYKLEHLANLMTADAVWGVEAIRTGSTNEQEQAGVAIVVPA